MDNVTIQKQKTKTIAAALVERLIKHDVSSVFGYPGASVLSIYNELSKTKSITHYLARHEQAAIHAAEGYARTSGKAGVVLVTSGPGFTNTITGIANAYTDSTPLVVLAGDVSGENKEGKVFQRVDIKSMTESCTKATLMLKRGDDINKIVDEAFKIANSNVKGPVVISLPRNILESEFSQEEAKIEYPKINKCDFTKEIFKLKTLTEESKKPLILVGGGGVDSSDEIYKFVKTGNIPVVSSLMGIGIFPSENSLYLGMIGINGTGPANNAIANCDLLIALGCSFSDRSTCKSYEFCKNAKIVNLNMQIQPKDYELQVRCDIKEFLKDFNKYNFKILPKVPWLNSIQAIKEEFCVYENKSDKLHSSYVLKTLSEYTKNFEPIVVTDVGQHQMLTAQYFNFNKPRKFITSGGLGTMGFGLPASIGAYVANTDNLIINITGDGSFQMNLQELATCREHNIPIKIIIMNNGYLGMVRQMQEKIYKNCYQVEMTNPDFVKIAEAYDLFAIRVTKQEELLPALNEAIKHKGTAIVDIMIDSFENI